MQKTNDQTAPGEPLNHAITQSAWGVNPTPETLYCPVPQFGADNSGLIALFTIIPLVILQWLTSRAATDLLMPLVPDYLKHFGWTFGYVGHITGVRFNSSSLPASDCNVDGYLSYFLAAI